MRRLNERTQSGIDDLFGVLLVHGVRGGACNDVARFLGTTFERLYYNKQLRNAAEVERKFAAFRFAALAEVMRRGKRCVA